jgi:hypothetical protein
MLHQQAQLSSFKAAAFRLPEFTHYFLISKSYFQLLELLNLVLEYMY